ncbi:MAG TPA: hypothetical protein VGQ87_00545 [Patescibacteria group bacterium]|jgi:hypothetical protein|nr:hypothetical protein [Patescibacteria group bacterium]
MAKVDFKKIIEWLAYILKCPICGYRYNIEQTKIIDSKDNKPAGDANLLVHTDCERCKSSVVFSIAVDGPEIFSVAMVTDLTFQDTSKFKNTKALSTDDVLAVHQFFQAFDGDFKSNLNKV